MNAASSPAPTHASRSESWIFDVVCAVYFLALAPPVVAAANSALRNPEGTAVWLGVVLLVAMLMETWAFPVKLRYAGAAVAAEGRELKGGVFLWIFHAAISMILVMAVAGCFGAKIGEGGSVTVGGVVHEALPWWMVLVFFVTVLKELFLLLFMIATSEARPNDRYARPSGRERIVDGILIAHACLAYSATWSVISSNVSLERGNPGMFVVNLFLSSLLFLILYLPLRIPWLLEERARASKWRDWLLLAGSILIVMIPAIARLP